MLQFLIAGILFTSIFTSVSQENSAAYSDIDTIGTFESHGKIWNKYVQWTADQKQKRDVWESKKQDYDNAIDRKQQMENAITQYKNKIAELENQKSSPVFVLKDEFETSLEWSNRCFTATSERDAQVNSKIDGINEQIKDFTVQIDNINNSAVAPEEPASESFSIMLYSVTFLLPVRMLPYDADSGLASFTYNDNIIFGKVDNTPSIFQLQGRVGDIAISMDKAKLIRAASDAGELWVSFKASPYPIRFEDQLAVPRSPDNIESQRRANDNKQTAIVVGKKLIGGLIIAALGGDQNAMAGYGDSIDQTSQKPSNSDIIYNDYYNVWTAA